VPGAVPFTTCVRPRPPSTTEVAEHATLRQWSTEQIGKKFIEAEVLICCFIWTFTDPDSDILPQRLGAVAQTLALALLILPRADCE